ncbi:uncharacterized protein BO66DRAFT_189214 [Aspergillus aculeatinus CBS 121060]|uniref:Uncharacterized protein n=1 Tax=Aspergillus aculeatinus CBS 121060 TaxID=1448322 RepID=A0ACD1GXY7_9EURO|nr:hypothetical protein BO66DRAFT_189214 [Aspergillus aculeatinus CBS 121060]RAH66172.1 hypothetical protein BO66DRAFT_189214 [Aspergillus aculeatinus CBS 121060]
MPGLYRARLRNERSLRPSTGPSLHLVSFASASLSLSLSLALSPAPSVLRVRTFRFLDDPQIRFQNFPNFVEWISPVICGTKPAPLWKHSTAAPSDQLVSARHPAYFWPRTGTNSLQYDNNEPILGWVEF